ncbi:MAG: uroporphyrinogen-III synthase [Ferruginibacter sp.]
MQNKIDILSTRDVEQHVKDLCATNNILLDTISFIATEPIETVEVQQEIENALLLSATVIFTSMNAVEAVAEFLFDAQPDWKIYCIGNTTKKLVIKYFGEAAIAGTASDATELAEAIVAEDGIEEIIFFCGDKRRDELPEILEKNSIELNEIVVYETIQVSQKINKEYHGVLFFSPSAVDSFFSVNKATSKTIFFAIGNTTAAAIKKYADNKIITADEPGKEALVEKAVEYFT